MINTNAASSGSFFSDFKDTKINTDKSEKFILPDMETLSFSSDLYKVDFKYYHKPENSQPITTKSMQEMYQGLEDRARDTYLRIHKAQEYSQEYVDAQNDEDTTKDELGDMYYKHIEEMNSPLIVLLNSSTISSDSADQNIDILTQDELEIEPIVKTETADSIKDKIVSNDIASTKTDKEVEDIYKVDFKYYHKPENSQPITTKSMQEMYQGLEDRARDTYLRIHKAQEYSQEYVDAQNDEDTTKDELRAMYYKHIEEMNSPLDSLLNSEF